MVPTSNVHRVNVLSKMFQYAFCCNEEEDVKRISTLIPVDDGKVHIVNIR